LAIHRGEQKAPRRAHGAYLSAIPDSMLVLLPTIEFEYVDLLVIEDSCHEAYRTLVNQKEAKIFILEDLKTSNMTRSAKAVKDDSGHWLKNGAKAKSGLNKAFLNVGFFSFAQPRL
jgi:hypothetical protein